MSKKTFIQFTNTYRGQTPIRGSRCLYNDENNNIIYKLEINRSQQPQLQASIEKEIQLQNELAGKIKQYLKIIEYAIEEKEQSNIVHMVVQVNDYKYSTLCSFEEINDQSIKLMQFKNILLLMMDLEQRKPKIFYFRQKNIFYYGNSIYLTIFGWTQEFQISNTSNQSLAKLEDLTFKISKITYLNEQGQEQQHNLTKHKEDLGLFFQRSILNLHNSKISIEDINTKCQDEELKNIAKIIKCFIINNGSLQEMNIQLQQSNQRQKNLDELIEEFEKYHKSMQLKAMDQELLKMGLDLQDLKELSADQLARYIEIQKNEQQSGNNLKKKRAKILIFQAEKRQQALSIFEQQSQDFHPNLIYFLKQNELEKLKEDLTLLKQIQVDQNKIIKYIELLQKMSLSQLDQVVLDNEQLSLIPVKKLKSIKNSTIQEFCRKKELEIQKSGQIERFDFEKALEAKDKYNKFQHEIKFNRSIKVLNENQLKFQEFELLDQNTQKTYQDSIIKIIESKRNSTNQDDKNLLKTLIDALNNSFQRLTHQTTTNTLNFKNQLYMDNLEGGEYVKNQIFNERNILKFSKKVDYFFQYRFTGDILCNGIFRLFLRKFQKNVQNSNYQGYQINDKKHGLGLSKINENHLKLGIFQFGQQLWGWEIVLRSKEISFYKGPFLNDQKDGLGILQKYDVKEDQKEDQKEVLIEQYVGRFQKDKMHGQGELKMFQKQQEITGGSNNVQVITVTQGEFKNDQLNGYATISQNDKIILKGSFKNGKKNGNVIEIQEQTTITGCYSDGNRTGTHITKLPDGTTTSEKYGSTTCSVF